MNNTMENPLSSLPSRECGGCTKCCEGWLSSPIYGEWMYKGKPCRFQSKNGCSIYEKRPEEPCKTFKCAWLDGHLLPEWFKPNDINLICTWREWKPDKIYLEVLECGSPIDSRALSWLFLFHLKTETNMHYQVHGGWNCIGDSEFVGHMTQKINVTGE